MLQPVALHTEGRSCLTSSKVGWDQYLKAYCKELPDHRCDDCPHDCIEGQLRMHVQVEHRVQEASIHSVCAWSKGQYTCNLA